MNDITSSVSSLAHGTAARKTPARNVGPKALQGISSVLHYFKETARGRSEFHQQLPGQGMSRDISVREGQKNHGFLPFSTLYRTLLLQRKLYTVASSRTSRH